MKKKFIFILFILLVLQFVYSTIQDEIRYNQLSFEEKILEAMNQDSFSSEKSVDKINFIKEVDGGYFCVATSTKESLVNFGYIKNDNKRLELAGKSFSSLPLIINNDDPTMFLRTKILNYNKKNYYYGCYQHIDDVQITVNNGNIEIHNLILNYLGEEHHMNFWFICSEHEPIIKIL